MSEKITTSEVKDKVLKAQNLIKDILSDLEDDTKLTIEDVNIKNVLSLAGNSSTIIGFEIIFKIS